MCIDKFKFVIYLLNKEISFNISSNCLKCSAHVDEDHMEGSVLRFFIEVLVFILCNLEKTSFKKCTKVTHFLT